MSDPPATLFNQVLRCLISGCVVVDDDLVDIQVLRYPVHKNDGGAVFNKAVKMFVIFGLHGQRNDQTANTAFKKSLDVVYFIVMAVMRLGNKQFVAGSVGRSLGATDQRRAATLSTCRMSLPTTEAQRVPHHPPELYQFIPENSGNDLATPRDRGIALGRLSRQDVDLIE